jgi:hypothetical protein
MQQSTRHEPNSAGTRHEARGRAVRDLTGVDLAPLFGPPVRDA